MRAPLLKAWRWVGAFGPEVMLCVARASVGPAHLGWWAVWDRAEHRLHERTRHTWRGLTVEPDRAAVRDGDVALEVELEPTRARREDLLLVASDYEQPFGTFTGELPVAGALREGWGVMERHSARW